MEVPVITVDVRQLDTLNWGPIRSMFPTHVYDAFYVSELDQAE